MSLIEKPFIQPIKCFQLLISNLVYGEPYTSIFTHFHLPSLLQELKECKHSLDVKYLLFTDIKSLSNLEKSLYYQQLKELMPLNLVIIPDEQSYDSRYLLQSKQLHHTVELALQENRVIHQVAADVYYGQGYFNTVISKFLKDKSDAVLVENFRCAYESLAPLLLNKKTPDTTQLYKISINNLHPLWTAAHWNAPFFSKIPYHILWGGGFNMISRGFSQSVPFFKPFDWMLTSNGCNDLNISRNIEKISFINLWHKAPSIELGPLNAYYPPFSSFSANTRSVALWAKNEAKLPLQLLENLNRYTIYNIPGAEIETELIEISQKIVDKIFEHYKEI